MKTSRNPGFSGALIWLLAALAALTVCRGGSPQALDPGSLFPQRAGLWEKDQEILRYMGDELFSYINGGAEIYHEFGFTEVVVQDYRSPKGGTISVEVYRMLDAEGAYGIYTFKRSTGGRVFPVEGGEGRLEDYYLNLWKGPFLATLTGFDQSAPTLEGLELLAREVEGRISAVAEVPMLVRRLPQADLIPGSVKYFRGPLALFNSHRFAAEDVFSPRSGVRGDYRNGDSLFIFEYSSDHEAQRIFGKAQKRLDPGPDSRILLERKGTYILVTLGKETLDRDAERLEDVRCDF